MNPDKNHIQVRLFEQISRTIPASVSLVDELCDLLKLGVDAVYRRINGTKLLTIEELELLCNTFKISFDSLCQFTGNTVTFDYSPMSEVVNFKHFIFSIMHDLEKVHNNKNGKAIYAAEDIPIFYNFAFPALANFKYFYWLKSVMNVALLQDVKFNSALIDEEILATGRKLYDLYSEIPSIEIWTEATPDSLFKQIEFYWESNLFKSKEDALAICDDVKELFKWIEKAAASGNKVDSEGNIREGQNNYQLYLSEIEIGDNCILTDIEGNKTVYHAFNTFNKLRTTNRSFSEEDERWLKNLISKSNPLSGVSEKRRSQFFKIINDRLELTRKKIEDGEGQ
jgi:hypothetical protein